MEKILITGMGVISPLGLDLKTSWSALINGKSGVDLITLFDTKDFKTKIAAQVNEEGFESLCKERIKKRFRKQMTRPVMMGLIAAQMAVEDSGLDFSKLNLKRCGIVIGSAGSDYPAEKMADVHLRDESRIIKSMANAHPAWISLHYKIEGPSMTVSTACSSAGYALASACDQITSGLCDIVIAGGTGGSILPEYLVGFGDMMALSGRNDSPKEASRPFDKERDGFVMGEGSGILILESESSALKRKAKVYAEIRRPALLGEGYSIMAPQKNGEGMAACMDLALSQAGVNPEDVGYINAHGTSTPLNDLYEAQAIKKVFKEHSSQVAVSSNKSMLGHTLAAAGGLEAVFTCKSIEEGILPPTINLTHQDPEIDLNCIPGSAIEKKINVAISNSFAFGGHNSVVPLIKYH
ncbi:MAG: beta-ketoacyl-[acyl-carrier-protein] synthase family protein [Candidatus Brocadiaceae bacterium]|nr:beta-ketoacyl-[acyl-carrier-protein] synthase family protein [Candidatus Brocadiaceae bacterium]